MVSLGTPALAAPGHHSKLDGVLNARANSGHGKSRVIVVFNSGWDGSEAKKLGGNLGRRLNLIGAQVVELSNGQLKKLADHPSVQSIHHDRPFTSTMNRVAAVTGARTVQKFHHVTGAGVGVAVLDSGVSSWHDDLGYLGWNPSVRTTGGQRVVKFVDYVNGRTTPYDDNGHGTHVSGIIAGNGYDSYGVRAGMAPDAHLVSLKVLDANGRGVISNVIAALDYVVANKSAYNVRVVNLSIGAAVTESYNTDPLTLAAKRVVDAGIVVVTAAGNLGKNGAGVTQRGGITAPGNAPWVLTVGAGSHEGTNWRGDDTIAGYSSRGPTAVDYAAKPDIVAYGTGVVSLADPHSLFYSTKAAFLLKGGIPSWTKPYLSLTGTSMAAPVVTGAVALMVQANPSLTPNMVKAILQYTAQDHAAIDALTEGAGFINVAGAVDLATYFATAQPWQRYPNSYSWSRQIIWGNHRVVNGAITPAANAFKTTTVWGAEREEDGDNIVWGTRCSDEDCDNIVWGTFEDDDNIVWGTMDDGGFNIVWGTRCDTEDCDNIVWGTNDDAFNIVWGTDCDGEDCDNIVWGTTSIDEGGFNIVWGTNEDGDNIVWGTSCLGEDCDNIVWGTNCFGEDCDNIVWGTADSDMVLFDNPEAPPVEEPVVTDIEILIAPAGQTTSGGQL
jgi:serine protease AprX